MTDILDVIIAKLQHQINRLEARLSHINNEQQTIREQRIRVEGEISAYRDVLSIMGNTAVKTTMEAIKKDAS